MIGLYIGRKSTYADLISETSSNLPSWFWILPEAIKEKYVNSFFESWAFSDQN